VRVRVEDLTPVERKLREAFLRGDDLDLRMRHLARDDPKDGAKWGSARTVRAAVIAWLLTAPGKPDTAHAALRLTGAKVVGELDLDYSGVAYPVRFTACHLAGPIRLYDAQTRHFSLTGCHLGHFYAANLTVNGTFRMSECVVTGIVRLSNAHISAMANLVGTRVTAAPDLRPGISNAPAADIAVEADHLRVDGNVWMAGFEADGEVILRSARINGDLDLREARLSNPGKAAIVMSRMHLDGRLDIKRADVTGQIRFYDAVIAGQADPHGTRIAASGGIAVNASHATIGAGLALYQLVTDGSIELLHADLNQTTLAEARVGAVHLQHARATELRLDTPEPPDGIVDLRHARIGVLHWENPKYWPERLRLDGLTYDRLQSPQPAARQVAWLLRDIDGYVPQPFEQLAAMYRAIGHDAEARTVLLTKERLRHKSMPWYARIWGLIQDAIVGYGYRPPRAAVWLLTLLALGTVVFATHRPSRTASGDGTVFNPFVYTLDRLFPVMGLGQKNEFTATPGTQWFGYLLTAAGWLLATAIAAAASRSLNRP
jgi:hypothetical protein